MISTRSVVLVIDTVVSLTLAKWETVSGRFGGYLSYAIAAFSHPLAHASNAALMSDESSAAFSSKGGHSRFKSNAGNFL